MVQRVVNGVRARSRLQQVNSGLNAQLQHARLKCGNEVEGELARLAAMTIAQKLRDAGVPTDLCWRWYTTGQCPWTACVHKYYEEYRGQGGKPAEEQKDHHNRASAEDDGPVPGTKCLNCKEEPQYRQKRKGASLLWNHVCRGGGSAGRTQAECKAV